MKTGLMPLVTTGWQYLNGRMGHNFPPGELELIRHRLDALAHQRDGYGWTPGDKLTYEDLCLLEQRLLAPKDSVEPGQHWRSFPE